MLAFHKTTITKPEIIEQLKAHMKADEFAKGFYWQDGRGCAVGCTIHSGNHAEYETRFGIPQMLARLEDCIFEGLPNETAKAWPLRFMNAVKPGSDLSLVGWQFLHWILTDKEVNPGIDHPLIRDSIKKCADVLVPLTKGLSVDLAAAAWAAKSAAKSAESAAWAAAWAAKSAAWAAKSAESAAWAAKSAKSAAWAAWAAAWAAKSAESPYIKMADKLIKLIEVA